MELIDFLKETKLYIGNIFEIIAALTGIWYLKKLPDSPREIKFFVYYLILIVILELYGYVPIIAYLENYEILSFYENSPFRRNLWWGNLLGIVTTICISWVFISDLKKIRFRKMLISLLWIYPFLSMISFFTVGEFFNAYDPYSNILSILILLLSVGAYYFQMLKSDKILFFYQDLKFYISIGIIIWNLCIIPLNIYSGFFSLENPFFMKIDTIIHQVGNAILYSVYTYGFCMDYKFRSSRQLKLRR